MGRLVYTSICSLDGYVADASGGFGWAAPDDEVHRFVNDLERGLGTHLCGRRLYEVLRYWDTAPTDDPEGSVGDDYARVWQATDKVVYSTTLEGVSAPRTRLERFFDPVEVAAWVREQPRDVGIGGPTLAAQALRAGVVDEVSVFRVPHVVGGGTPVLPGDVRMELRLTDSRTFGNGTTYARYDV
ncbi:dihydrofolate reductase family protein [Intrasporangium flavum]|uniref:dihydrofolate reductase family protein n=1 Tax=Intrasporangium flavum TaxID=1428657 RepID=UPI00096D0B13|nr:dihydrofolate reductase family protein [Intrasporangium flavum]